MYWLLAQVLPELWLRLSFNKAGYKVKIVEKQLFPRFVIGESLLPRCMEALTEAGLC